MSLSDYSRGPRTGVGDAIVDLIEGEAVNKQNRLWRGGGDDEEAETEFAKFGSIDGALGDARTLVRKSIEEIPVGADGAAEPLHALQRSLAAVHEAFLKSAGREPGADDTDYWKAFSSTIKAFHEEMKSRGVM